jgi:hypothetical protein
MPARQFWSMQHPTSITFTMALNATDPQGNPQYTVKVHDQAHAVMAWGGGELPAGWAPWAFVDGVRAAMEAFELGEPNDAKRAFARTAAAWRKDAKKLDGQRQRT